jgi:hypothetical protein
MIENTKRTVPPVSSTATAIAPTYRGIVFWMLFVIGAILIHRTKSFSKRELPSDKTKRLASHEPDEEPNRTPDGALGRDLNHEQHPPRTGAKMNPKSERDNQENTD